MEQVIKSEGWLSPAQDSLMMSDGLDHVKSSGFSVSNDADFIDLIKGKYILVTAAAVRDYIDGITVGQAAYTQADKEKVDSIDTIRQDLDSICDTILKDGNANEIVLSTDAGICRSGVTVGSDEFADDNNDNVVATEAGVINMFSWGSF